MSLKELFWHANFTGSIGIFALLTRYASLAFLYALLLPSFPSSSSSPPPQCTSALCAVVQVIHPVLQQVAEVEEIQVKGVAHHQKPVGAKTILWLERLPSGKGMCHVKEVESRVWSLLPMA